MRKGIKRYNAGTYEAVIIMITHLNQAPSKSDEDVLYSYVNVTAEGSDLFFKHQKRPFQNSLAANFSFSGSRGKSLAPQYRIERGAYWQRPSPHFHALIKGA